MIDDSLFLFIIIGIIIYLYTIFFLKHKNDGYDGSRNEKEEKEKEEKEKEENDETKIPTINVGMTVYNNQPMRIYFHSIDDNDNKFIQVLQNYFPFTHTTTNIQSCHAIIVPSFYPLVLSQSGASFQSKSIKDSYYSYAYNVNFLCNLYEQDITCIVNDGSSITELPTNAILGVLNKHHAHYFLYIIQKIIALRITIKVFENFSDMANHLSSNQIHAMFLICSHPNTLINTFSFQTKIKFFDFYSLIMKNETTINLVQFHFPELHRSFIKLFSYRTFNNKKILNSFKLTCSLFVKKKENIYSEALLRTILKKHSNINHELPFYSYNNDHIHICPDHYDYDNQALKVYKEKFRVFM